MANGSKRYADRVYTHLGVTSALFCGIGIGMILAPEQLLCHGPAAWLANSLPQQWMNAGPSAPLSSEILQGWATAGVASTAVGVIYGWAFVEKSDEMIRAIPCLRSLVGVIALGTVLLHKGPAAMLLIGVWDVTTAWWISTQIGGYGIRDFFAKRRRD